MHKALLISALMAMPAVSQAADYVLDATDGGAHSFVQFKASHVGISPLWGRFNQISGRFSYDTGDLAASTLHVEVGTTSLDTAHEARNTHLMSGDYIDAAAFPLASFDSTSVSDHGDGTFTVTGNLTLREITREISILARRTGEGETYFGDYRVGFEGTATINAKDFGIGLDPDPMVELVLSIEGVRQ